MVYNYFRKDITINKYIFALVVIVILLAGPVIGQELYNMEGTGQRLTLHTDYAFFKADSDDELVLEIYYKVFNSYLTFVRDGGKFTATYDITIVIYDGDDYQVNAYNKEKKITVQSYDKTQRSADFRTSQINFTVKPGKYKILCRIEDKNSGKVAEKTMKAKLPEYNFRRARLSGVEFAQRIDTAFDGSPFNKGDWSVIPSVIRAYEGDTAAPLLYYNEIYQGNDNRETVFIETNVRDNKLDLVYWDTVTSVFNEGIIRQLRRINLSGISSGKYYLEIALKGRRMSELETVKYPFLINWSPEAMIIHDYKKAIQQLELVADHEGIDEVKKAKNNIDRIKAWQNFWKMRDPTPNTEFNEARESYYNRIRYANRYFSVLNKEGWTTDRGRIFIQYGEPDQTTDRPFEMGTQAYQVWNYYHLPIQRRFVFVDEWGDGDYRLIYPYDGIIR